MLTSRVKANWKRLENTKAEEETLWRKSNGGILSSYLTPSLSLDLWFVSKPPFSHLHYNTLQLYAQVDMPWEHIYNFNKYTPSPLNCVILQLRKEKQNEFLKKNLVWTVKKAVCIKERIIITEKLKLF